MDDPRPDVDGRWRVEFTNDQGPRRGVAAFRTRAQAERFIAGDPDRRAFVQLPVPVERHLPVDDGDTPALTIEAQTEILDTLDEIRRLIGGMAGGALPLDKWRPALNAIHRRALALRTEHAMPDGSDAGPAPRYGGDR
jgi:hypothetical protein